MAIGRVSLRTLLMWGFRGEDDSPYQLAIKAVDTPSLAHLFDFGFSKITFFDGDNFRATNRNAG